MHDVIARPAPEHDFVPQHALGNTLHRNDGAVGHVADEPRRAFVAQLRAEAGAKTVRADHGRSRDAAAILGPHANPLAVILDPRGASRCFKLDIGQGPAGIEQHIVQIDPMNDDVGMLEAAAKRIAGRHARDLAAVERIQHDQRRRQIARSQAPPR